MGCGEGESSAAGDHRVQPPPGIWLKGDLHLHSAHSTDALDSPVDAVIAKVLPGCQSPST
jgi:hypothetical protein